MKKAEVRRLRLRLMWIAIVCCISFGPICGVCGERESATLEMAEEAKTLEEGAEVISPEEGASPVRAKALTEAKGSNEARDHFKKGMGYYRSRRYDEAIEEFGKVLAIDPDHARALKYLKGSQKKMADALEAKLRARKRALEKAWRKSRLEEIRRLRTKKRLERTTRRVMERKMREELRLEARKAREERLKKTRQAALLREEAKAYFKQGKAYYLNGMYQEAIDRFNKALALDPEFSQAAKYLERAKQGMEEVGAEGL